MDGMEELSREEVISLNRFLTEGLKDELCEYRVEGDVVVAEGEFGEYRVPRGCLTCERLAKFSIISELLQKG